MKTNKYLLIGVFALFVTIFLWAARWYTLNQNEQTQPWTKNWEFCLRVTDPTGKALLSSNR